MNRELKLIVIAFTNALRGIRSAATTSSMAILTIAIVLVLVGSVSLLVENMTGILDEFGSELQLTAYLDDSYSEHDQRELAQRVGSAPGVDHVEFVTKQEALERFERLAGGAELLAGLDENPLPASLEIHLRPEARTAEAILLAEASQGSQSHSVVVPALLSDLVERNGNELFVVSEEMGIAEGANMIQGALLVGIEKVEILSPDPGGRNHRCRRVEAAAAKDLVDRPGDSLRRRNSR